MTPLLTCLGLVACAALVAAAVLGVRLRELKRTNGVLEARLVEVGEQLEEVQERLQEFIAAGEKNSERMRSVRAEAHALAAQASEAQLHRVLSEFPGVILLAAQGEPNPVLEGQLAARWKESSGSETNEVRDALREVTRGGAGKRFELTLGETLFEVGVEPLRDAPGALLVALDVTARRDQERQRIQLGLADAQRLEGLGVLAGGIAHDFNNLLVGVLANAALVLEETEESSPHYALLSSISQAARRAAELTRKLLAYAGRGSSDVKPHDLSQVARETAQLLSAYGSKKVHLELDLADALPPIDCDSAQLRQIVMNLITNAIDAIGDQSGRVTLRTRLADLDAEFLANPALRGNLKPGRHILLEVEDTGSGMSEETRAKIFDPFFTTKPAGHGLGMSAVLGSVRAHGGALQVSSEVGVGTVFRLAFPRSKFELRRESTKTRPALRVEGCVLVADDEPEVRRAAARILQRVGFEILEAGDGEQAVEVYQQQAARVGLLLVDLSMPKRGGLEVLAEVRQLDDSVPVILTSGYSDQGLEHALSDVTHFLQKPYSPADLVRAVSHAMTGALSAVPSQARLRKGISLETTGSAAAPAEATSADAPRKRER